MQPTNHQLRQLLIDLGFELRNSVEPKCQVFEHSDSKARVLLPLNKDEEPAREVCETGTGVRPLPSGTRRPGADMGGVK